MRSRSTDPLPFSMKIMDDDRGRSAPSSIHDLARSSSIREIHGSRRLARIPSFHARVRFQRGIGRNEGII